VDPEACPSNVGICGNETRPPKVESCGKEARPPKSSLPAQVFRKRAKRQNGVRRDIELALTGSFRGKEAARVINRSVGPRATGANYVNCFTRMSIANLSLLFSMF
jgi:hypothetical protein